LGAPSRPAKGWRPPPWRIQAFGRGLFHRRQECIAHDWKQLRMLMTVDKIRGAADKLAESRELHHHSA